MTENKMLITKLKRRQDDRVDLYGRGHKWPDILLHDISDLQDVGIAFEDLPVGVEQPCRFFAVYTESEKVKSSGRPYLDIVCLEPNGNGQHVPTAGVADAAILDKLDALYREMAQIRKLLAAALQAGSVPAAIDQDLDPTGLPDLLPDEPIPADDQPTPAETPAAPGPKPLSDGQARRMFGSIAGPAIRDGQVTSTQVNDITKAAVATGWRDALEKLQTLIDQGEVHESEQIAA